MKHFIITLLSAMALSVSGFALAGGQVVEAPTDANPAAQVAPAPTEEEVADADECDADKADCTKDEGAETADNAPVNQVMPEENAEETAGTEDQQIKPADETTAS